MPNNFYDRYFGAVDESQKVEVPTGGEFQQNGFIGPITISMLWRVWTAVNVTGPEFKSDVPTPVSFRQLRSGDYHFYWKRPADADKAIKVIGEDTRAEQYWVFSIPTADIMNAGNLDAIKEGFGPEIAMMSNVKTLKSRKRRHEFHLITLPAIIAAVADVMGIDNAGFDLSEISMNELNVNDDWSRQYVGDPDNGEGFEESILFQRRKALWESLGETNPLAYTLDSQRNTKFNVTSDLMKKCMQIVYYPPKVPVYGRLVGVNDPQIGAEYETESGWRRRQVAAVTRLYDSIEDARADAEKDLEEFNSRNEGRESGGSGGGSGGGGSAGSPAAQGPPLPEAWADMREDWVGIISEYLGKPDLKLTKDLKEKPNMFACSEAEALEWKAYLESEK